MNLIFFCGAIVIYFGGNIVLSFVGSNTSLLPNSHLLLILIIIYLETNHSNCSTLITTKMRFRLLSHHYYQVLEF